MAGQGWPRWELGVKREKSYKFGVERSSLQFAELRERMERSWLVLLAEYSI